MSDAGAACPECGTLLLRTLQGDGLQYTTPEHLLTLRRASLIVILALLAWIVLYSSGQLLPLIRTETLLGSAAFDTPRPPLLTALSGAALLTALWGWWRLASPDPSTPWMTGLNLRCMLRVTTIAAAAMTILDRVSLVIPVLDVVIAILATVWLAHLIVAMLYIRQLGGRLAARHVQHWVIGVLIATGVLFIPCLPFTLIAFIVGPVIINALVIGALVEMRVALKCVKLPVFAA